VAARSILVYGDPTLRGKSKPVKEIDKSIKNLVADMIATLKRAGGLGLAAAQVGVSARIFVVDLSAIELTESVRVFINPVIIEKSGETLMEEGCLSFPGIYQKIVRPEKIRVKATDLDGKDFELAASEMLARAILHEYDHLDGILFIDYLSSLSRTMIKGKLNKLKKLAAAS
jgi:peptide deformylase